MPYDVKIRYSCGAYVTNTVDGKRASSTMSAMQAAQALALKLMDGTPASVHCVEPAAGPSGVGLWRIDPQVLAGGAA